MKLTARIRRLSLLTVTAVACALFSPLAGTALANHGDRVLDVTPETASKLVGEVHTMTARLCFQDVGPSGPICTDEAPTFASGPVNIDFELESGPNNTDGNTPLTPDETCSVPAEVATCSVDYTGTIGGGTDTWRAWIDHDGNNATNEADTLEGRNETTMPGVPDCDGAIAPEPDCTDVVSATWSVNNPPSTLDCDDANGPDTEHETNPSESGPQSNETYTCYVKDSFGNPVGDKDPGTAGQQEIMVFGENESGVNDPDSPANEGPTYTPHDYECHVGNADDLGTPPIGQCTIEVTQGELETGTAEICFWVGTEAEGATLCASELTDEDAANDTGSNHTGNDLADQVEKTWEARTASEGNGGLDAEPETATVTTGNNHSITATVYDQFGQPFQGSTPVNFEFFTGSPSDTDGNTSASPDKTCTTQNASSCSVTYTSATPGRDLVCVWIHTAPALAGNNQNGTCDGEGLNDADDTAGSADSPEPKEDDVDVVSATWKNANPATKLDCEPETAQTERGQTHDITCTATQNDNPVSGTEVDVEATGANDPDNGDSKNTPDFTCTTDNTGTCQVPHTVGGGGATGTTKYRAWIDDDYFNTTSESDNAEGRNENNDPGTSAEPDKTDVVENSWVPKPNRTIDIHSNKSSRKKGKNVRIFGKISATESECAVGQTVRLKSRRPGGRFHTVTSTITDGQGNYAFRIKVQETKEYRSVAPKNSTCKLAKSSVITVTAT